MTIWDKLRSILGSEARDIGEELGKARDNFDAALTRKEEELAASPKERMDMILDDIGDSDDEFDRIVDKAEGRTSAATATAEVQEAAGDVTPAAPETPTTSGAAAASDAVDEVSEPAAGASEVDRSAEVAAAEKAAAEAEALEAAEERQRLVAERRAAADAKFEEQKAKADDLLDELRGELGIDE